MLEKLPASIAAMERPGFPSFLTKHTKMSLNIKAGEKSKIIRRYVFVISKTSLSAPNARVIFPERNMPVSIKIRERIRAVIITWKKHRFPCPVSFFPLKMEYFVAPPMPSIRPHPFIKLYMGMARFNAVKPFAPTPFEIKKVSAKM